jgi:prevent-host-death family protein
MKELTISVTQAARRFADCVNRVRYQGTSFVLHKNGVPVARIVPVEASSGADLERLATALREARSEALEDDRIAVEMFPDPGEPPRIQQPSTSPKRLRLNW